MNILKHEPYTDAGVKAHVAAWCKIQNRNDFGEEFQGWISYPVKNTDGRANTDSSR